MSWKFPFIVVRPSGNDAATVYEAATLKEAQYWLRYIALPGDALFQTPAHPKCAGASAPKYLSHLEARGVTKTDLGAWSKNVGSGTPVILPLSAT